jgi:predicted dinucleotide-utilizing enzyme
LAKKGFKDLTIIGCGLIGDKQLQSMLEQFDHIERVFVYDQLVHVMTTSPFDTASLAFSVAIKLISGRCCCHLSTTASGN